MTQIARTPHLPAVVGLLKKDLIFEVIWRRVFWAFSVITFIITLILSREKFDSIFCERFANFMVKYSGMEKKILNGIEEIRSALVALIGTDDLPKPRQLSKPALEKVAKEFKKLNLRSNEWITEQEFEKYFKGYHYGTGKFIREELGFSNFFKKGQSYYYNRSEIQALAAELTERKVNLKRYIELKADEQAFLTRIKTAAQNRKKSSRPYYLSEDLSDIETSLPPRPPIEMVTEDLKTLCKEFDRYDLGQYIDVYRSNYAMVKFEYHFDRYTSSSIKSTCKKWCENFNYANTALEMLTGKRGTFKPLTARRPS
ncbi:hypothetical protein EZ428_18080 [Pedobacter frigiditerrae]|uniref:Uncharacterized protein n=1 Tax=Pedobacter frigiditerrae TaxID=2530452 RepID=A0A4R0MP32_9SPHI|nr:hypothetical protein [Pedobacter frigiditerrae]TCC88550.1 hypothetical protein EZ428_18080 [Pedobacter frigiditerrae]